MTEAVGAPPEAKEKKPKLSSPPLLDLAAEEVARNLGAPVD